MKLKTIFPKDQSQRIFLTISFLLLLFPTFLFAQGWIIPERVPDIQQFNRFELIEQNIEANLIEQVANYQIKQTFQNKSNRQIEGIFYFPLPKGSQITDFTYIVNNKKMKGELLEKGKARGIYEEIVRQHRDPALLEYMNQDLFKASIFPIPAGDKCGIEIEFTQILSKQDQFYQLNYPLFQKKQGHKIRSFSSDAKLNVNLKLKSEKGIQQIYSPNSKIDIARKNQDNIIVSFEGKIKDISNNNLQLFYQLGSDEVGLSVLSYQKGKEDGYFLFIASPEFELDIKKQQPKDVLFVLDVSGSMEGEKIVQAKEALIYCLDRLHSNDRFNVIAFSTISKLFKEELQSVSSKDDARRFIQDLEARGGTNIHEALTKALDQNNDSNRLFSVVFLTDGLPTSGIRDDKLILKDVVKNKQQNVRVFSFGVGYDVNTFLIDQIATQTNAVSDYVKPEESIEAVVSSFYDKISSPVLTNLNLDWEDVSVTEIYPRKMPDLFKGGEIVVLGQYKSAGKGDVNLSGSRDGESFKYSSSFRFASSNTENDFIPHLWASRKIGYLLDEIRFNESNQELIDEVVKLSKEYGIVTPYTSYLAQEDEPIIATIRPNRPIPLSRQNRILDNLNSVTAESVLYMKSGESAVNASIAIQDLKSANNINLTLFDNVRHLKGKVFKLENELWSEQDLGDSLEVFKIKYGSTAYFNLFSVLSDYAEIFQLGDKVKFSLENIIVWIDKDGESDLSLDDLKRKLKL